MTNFGIEPIFGNAWLPVVITIVLTALLLWGPQFAKLSRGRWFALTGLRLATILLLLLALIRPTKQTTIQTPRTSSLLILADTSRSMLLPSGQQDSTRYAVQRSALEKAQPFLQSMAGPWEIHQYGYDASLTNLVKEGKLVLPEAPTGQQTDIATALQEALLQQQGKRVGGVILLGDGAQNALDPAVETMAAARRLRDDFSAPLFAAAIGPAADAAQVRDISVERLEEQFTCFVKNELIVTALVRVRGFVNQDLPIELEQEDSAGQKKSLGKQTIRATQDGQQINVQFRLLPDTVGNFRLRVSAQPQNNELVIKNNQLDSYLQVREGGIRVLYLDGEKRFEQKFLRRALNNSPDIELDDRILDRRTAKQGPVDLVEELKTTNYDAFILGDLDSSLLTKESQAALAAQIKLGKGLVMIGGRNSFGRGKYLGTPLAEVLPIKMLPIEGSNFANETQLEQFYLRGPIVPVVTRPHPLTTLAQGTANSDAWKKLPPLAWANKIQGVNNNPGTRVLLETPTQQPLMVSGEYGQGRVLCFAGESTYRWSMHGFDSEHRRFWRQIVLWLVKRDDDTRDEVWVKLDQRRVGQGGRVQLTAGARHSSGEVITNAQWQGKLIGPDGNATPLRISAGAQDQVASVLQPKLPGTYHVEVTALQGNKELGTAKSEFFVYDRDAELSNPAADPDQMSALAAVTKDDGGRLIRIEELEEVLKSLKDRPQEFDVREIKWKLGSTPIDAWAFFLVMVGLLGLEWWLRKKWGLV